MSFYFFFYYLIFLHYLELKLKEGVGRREVVGKGFDEQSSLFLRQPLYSAGDKI